MRRVVVVGQSGSGKTTLARELARRLAVPHVELDALFHGPGWQPRPTFVADVDAATGSGGWVADGNYTAVRDLVWSRADTVVWLDLPRWLPTVRVTLRTGRRLLSRRPLYNGNRERWRTVLRASHPVRWSWQTQPRHRAEYERRLADPGWGYLAAVRLTSPADVARWLATVPPAHTTGSGASPAAPFGS